MNEIAPDIETTDDGSATLRHPVFGDTYHSTRGAVGESVHVFITNGLATIDKTEIRILEVGFGSGLNAWQSLRYGAEHGKRIDYTAIELYPVSAVTAASLGYTHDPLFAAMHAAPWRENRRITDGFTITKLDADLTAADKSWSDKHYDMIYFDAFAPDTQPEMWRTDIFRTLYNTLGCGGILVTYSAKGVVKEALRAAGFEVRRLPGALGKRHMLRAVKH